MPAKIDKATSEFIEQMGLVFQAEGLPRISGKIFGVMVITGETFSLSELSTALKVSRGSISTNTRMLEDTGMVERTAIAGDRQTYYQLAPDPYATLLRGSIQRTSRARQLVRNAEKSLPASRKTSRKNLHALGDFYDAFVSGYESILKDVSKKNS